jgi:hypothetical protein
MLLEILLYTDSPSTYTGQPLLSSTTIADIKLDVATGALSGYSIDIDDIHIIYNDLELIDTSSGIICDPDGLMTLSGTHTPGDAFNLLVDLDTTLPNIFWVGVWKPCIKQLSVGNMHSPDANGVYSLYLDGWSYLGYDGPGVLDQINPLALKWVKIDTSYSDYVPRSVNPTDPAALWPVVWTITRIAAEGVFIGSLSGQAVYAFEVWDAYLHDASSGSGILGYGDLTNTIDTVGYSEPVTETSPAIDSGLTIVSAGYKVTEVVHVEFNGAFIIGNGLQLDGEYRTGRSRSTVASCNPADAIYDKFAIGMETGTERFRRLHNMGYC